MGITLKAIQTLQDKSVLTHATTSLLDVGSSNLYQANPQGVVEFLKVFGICQDKAVTEFAKKMARGSAYDSVTGGKNDSFVGELFEKAGIRYEAIDIAAGYRTTILDLNHQGAPAAFRNAFDVVLNFGTTEHLLNQFNAFRVIHDCVRVGGYMVHSLPCVGYTNHGYLAYTPRCFFDLAGYNGYEVVYFEYEGPGGANDLARPLLDYAKYFPALSAAAEKTENRKSALESVGNILDISLLIIMRKVHAKPFFGALETTTSVGTIPDSVRGEYQNTVH